MIFRGCYFKDDEIVQAWDRDKDVPEFHIELKDGKGMIFYKTNKEDQKRFVEELERRMAYKGETRA